MGECQPSTPLPDEANITDPFLMPHTTIKVRRLCVNPLCSKRLSKLNKQALCFGCHDQAMLKRLQTAGLVKGRLER
jgi:hypothetical protein